MKLINSNTLREIKIGDSVQTFRGERGILTGFTEPHKPSSTGKVYVNTGGDFDNQWYPSVIGGQFVNE